MRAPADPTPTPIITMIHDDGNGWHQGRTHAALLIDRSNKKAGTDALGSY
jgi:hypothetical protein